jgi:hypothetical protein
MELIELIKRELKPHRKFWIGNKRHTITDVIKDEDGNILRVYSVYKNQIHISSAEDVILILEEYQREKELKAGTKKINSDGSISKGMTSQQASSVKNNGHRYEYDYADATAGEVRGTQEKGDVLIREKTSKKVHLVSVKAARKKIQVSLYSRSRFEKSKEFGELSKKFITCIDAFPLLRSQHVADKSIGKNNVMEPMRNLAIFLSQKHNLDYFLLESFFNVSASYLAIKDNTDGTCWHTFPQKIISEKLSEFLIVENSRARNVGQMDDQKVVFKAQLGKSNGYYCEHSWISVGEIEMRNDSAVHYREIKFWMYIDLLLELLQRICGDNKKEIIRGEYKIVLYDDAIEELKFLEDVECEKEN